jgi:hypothetical protein
MSGRAELEQLLARLVDGPADAAANRRLGELLRTHPELQGEYLDHLQLHALLQWRGGAAGAGGTGLRPEVVTAGRRSRPLRRGLAAALVLLAAGLGAPLLFRSPEARATPDVVERLIDWNLDITQAPSPDARQRAHHREKVSLRAALAQADLSPQDRQLAETLLENGAWLAANDDPTAAADRFNALSDELLARMDAATSKKDARNVRRLADFYRRVAERGIQANVERAERSGALDFQRRRKLERVLLRDAERTEKLAALLERAPDASRKEVRRALDLSRRKARGTQPRRGQGPSGQ